MAPAARTKVTITVDEWDMVQATLRNLRVATSAVTTPRDGAIWSAVADIEAGFDAALSGRRLDNVKVKFDRALRHSEAAVRHDQQARGVADRPTAPTLADRDALRALQDRLIAAAERLGYHEDTQLSSDYPGSPTLRHCRLYLQTDWQELIERTVNNLERRTLAGLR